MNLHTISSQVATLHGENNPLIPNREIDDAAVDLDLESCCLDGVKCSCLKKKKPYEILIIVTSHDDIASFSVSLASIIFFLTKTESRIEIHTACQPSPTLFLYFCYLSPGSGPEQPPSRDYVTREHDSSAQK